LSTKTRRSDVALRRNDINFQRDDDGVRASLRAMARRKSVLPSKNHIYNRRHTHSTFRRAHVHCTSLYPFSLRAGAYSHYCSQAAGRLRPRAWPPWLRDARTLGLRAYTRVNVYKTRQRCCPVSERLAKQTKRLVLCAVQLLSD